MTELLKKWDQYKPGDVGFIEHNRKDLYHKMYIEYIRKHENIKSILEIGPGQLIEYPEIRKIRTIKYNVLETSKSFIDYIAKMYPDVNIIKGVIERFVNEPVILYDLVRVCDVVEHTYPVVTAIKNITTCARRFHITLFKWSVGGSLRSIIRQDRQGIRYFSSNFDIIKLINEIKRHAIIDSAHVLIKETSEVMEFNDYWVKYYTNNNPLQNSIRGHRLIITGVRL